MAPKKSMAWDHFIDKGNYIGECKMCTSMISYKSGVSNLMKHVQRKHPIVNLLVREEEHQEQRVQIWLDQEMGQSPPGQPQPPLTSSTHVTTCPSTSTRMSPSISALLRSDCNEIQKDIDDRIMNLFIWDMHPFIIVEDRGFRELIKFAFPSYVIPPRKYFANNLLQEQYEAVKISTKAMVIEDATTICLTISTWSSKNSEHYLAIMGHYIDKDFVLQSVLLECKLVESKLTGTYLAKVLHDVAREWNVSDRILLVVIDNDESLENAIKQLQWKHFSCYIHTLNSAVQKALGSHTLTELLNKVKVIISHCEKNNLDWKKFNEDDQKQANKIVKRHTQDMETIWTSLFYVLQRFVELKDEIKCTLKEVDSITMSSYEWELCESLSVVLQPCEEVRKEMSDRKHVSGSSMLPVTVGLTSALNEIADPVYQQTMDINVFLQEVETFRQDLLSDIKTRFDHMETNKIFTTWMFLDPRYKLYFENPSVADKTKKYIVVLVTDIINKESATETVSKSQSLIWKHYNETMANVRPEGTPKSRAFTEVERYLEDRVLPLQMNPIDWWRSNRNTYPYLAKLARTNLNAMITITPNERLFSVAENIITKQGSSLESRVLQQLLFLQQNKK